MAPKLFGFPLWRGKITKRIAKKHVDSSLRWILKYHGDKFANMGNGDMINDCSAENRTIESVQPDYFTYGGGEILTDITLTTKEFGGSCSLTHCGVSPAKTQKQIEDYLECFLKGWFFGEAGIKYYDGFKTAADQKVKEKCTRQLEALKAGKHIVSEQGILLPEYRS